MAIYLIILHCILVLLLIGRLHDTLGLNLTNNLFLLFKLIFFVYFQPMLRRMVYLSIKELSTIAEDVIIVTSSLTKDMTGREEGYCANAIRALCMITDATMLQAIERYMKQAIVDKSHSVSSNALVSSLVSYDGGLN
jgi:coatomer protein complex subunit gamma